LLFPALSTANLSDTFKTKIVHYSYTLPINKEDRVLDNLVTFQERPNALLCRKRLHLEIWKL